MTDAISPLARFMLLLFMIALAVAGTALAGAYYRAIDLPQQQSVTPPENLFLFAASACKNTCQRNYEKCSDAGVKNKFCPHKKDVCNKNCDCTDCTSSCDTEYLACQNKPGYTEGDCAGIHSMCYSSCLC